MRRNQLRIALYSHDAMGIGHMRRNLLIADSLVRLPARPSVLLISGAKEAAAFRIPAGVDRLTLPAFRKRANGSYGSRSLTIPVKQLRDLRSRIILAAVAAFEPDVFVVDKVPRGILNELDSTLELLKSHADTRCILGLRDILDAPEAVRRDWAGASSEQAIRSYYDAVWVYGDPAVYDPVAEYRFSADTAAKISYTGYLDPAGRVRREEAERGAEHGAEHEADESHMGLPSGRMILCQMGGGQDGARLAETFSRAAFPPDTRGMLLTGPFLPRTVRARVERLAAQRADLQVLGFRSRPGALLRRADRVVAMGGYNTLCEVVSHEKPALVVPRVKPRREQLIRATRFSELGLVDVLHPGEASPGALTEWLTREIDPPRQVRDRIDFGGLQRLPTLLERVLSGRKTNGSAHAV